MYVCVSLLSEWFILRLPSPPGVAVQTIISVDYNLTIIKNVLPIHSRHHYYCTQSLQ